MKTNMYHGAPPRLFAFAKTLRLQPTPAEAILWERLSGNQTGFKFRRQHPLVNYIVDFYCHALKYIIEVDGGVHKEPSHIFEDQNQDLDLHAKGYYVERFTNNQVLYDLDTVMLSIDKTIEMLQRKRLDENYPQE